MSIIFPTVNAYTVENVNNYFSMQHQPPGVNTEEVVFSETGTGFVMLHKLILGMTSLIH
jgi:hypothetical protein